MKKMSGERGENIRKAVKMNNGKRYQGISREIDKSRILVHASKEGEVCEDIA
jgi:K+/H+ antiporter YhaU regulatory subunit KhtT